MTDKQLYKGNIMFKAISTFLFIFIMAGSVAAQSNTTAKRSSTMHNRGFGLGIIIGEPTGPCFKNWLGNKSAVDGAIAWSFDRNGSLHIHADYLLHIFSAVDVNRGWLPFYYGIGGRIKFGHDDDDDRLGVRIPLGFEYLFDGAPPGIFIELVPILDLVPDTDIEYNAAIGFRYYF
jgi:hypothetical protein